MNSLPPDPYKILGVPKDAQLPEIRTAYKKLALKCHPDKFQDEKIKAEKQDEFQKVAQAYELLRDEKERAKYDDMVMLNELRKAAKNMSNTSAPRTPPRAATFHQYADIRDVNPRPDTFSGPTPRPSTSGHKFYTHAHSYSFEDELGARAYFEEKHSRRTASFEHKPKEERRRRDEWDLERERDREHEKREKEKRREEKKRAEKLRQRESEDRRRHKSQPPYVEDYDYVHRSDRDHDRPRDRDRERKKSTSSSRKHDSERREKDKSRGSEPQKHDIFLDAAFDYITNSRKKVGAGPLGQSSKEGINIAYATPPATPQAAHCMSGDEDVARRSSAKASGRRASHNDTPRDKNSSGHRKSSSGGASPIVVDVGSPPLTHSARIPPLSRSHTTLAPDAPPVRKLDRSHTMHEPSSHSARPMPSIARAATWIPGQTPDVSDRGRQRQRTTPQAAPYYSEDEEDVYATAKPRRGSTRRSARSPEPATYTQRYAVNTDNRSVPVEEYYQHHHSSGHRHRDESPHAAKKTSGGHRSTSYYAAQYNGGSSPRVVEARPPTHEEVYHGPYKVRISPHYSPEHVTYSPVPHTYRDKVPAYG